jgi:hypothetical protein
MPIDRDCSIIARLAAGSLFGGSTVRAAGPDFDFLAARTGNTSIFGVRSIAEAAIAAPDPHRL